MRTQSKLTIGLSFLVIIAISILTLTPIQAPALGAVSHPDKVYHALAFGSLAFPVAFFRPSWLVLALPAYAAFGGVIEIIQPFVGRDCSIADWIADLTGLGLGSLVARVAAVVAPLRWQVRRHPVR